MGTWIAGVLLVAVLAALVGCAHAAPPGPRDVLTPAERRALTRRPAGPAVLVAVVDGGLDARHPALRARVVRSLRAPGLPPQIGVHGTQVAGVVAGAPTASWSGGLAADARLLDVQVLDRDGQGSAPVRSAAAPPWTSDRVEATGRARPGLTCPGYRPCLRSSGCRRPTGR